MREELRRPIARVVRAVEGGSRRRRALSFVMAKYYMARGADHLLIEDALAQSGTLNLSATRSTMRWAAALAGGATLPKGFRPERRLASDEAKERGLTLVEQRFAETGDDELGRHRSYLNNHLGAGDPQTRAFVQETLDRHFASAAVAPTGELAPAAGVEVLAQLCDALDRHGMRPFLVSGTLLGLVRNGALLEHDYDLDLGLLPGAASVDQVAAALADIDGMQIEVEEWRVWGTHPSGVSYDIFVHYEENGRFYHATLTHAWWNTPFELAEAQMGDRSFWIPDDTDTYLTENYGSWQHPTVFYHKSFDTPNREYRQTSESLLYLYETAMDALKRKDRYVCESAVAALHTSFGIDLRDHFNRTPLLGERS